MSRDRIIHHTSADVWKNRGLHVPQVLHTHTCPDDECHFRQKVSAGTLRLLVPSRARIENFEGRFPVWVVGEQWNTRWREGDRWQTDREKPRRVCPSSWTGSCLPRRTAANVWQAAKNRPTCTDCILIDPNMRGRAHRDSQARRHYVRPLAPSRDLFLWNFKLAEGVQDSRWRFDIHWLDHPSKKRSIRWNASPATCWIYRLRDNSHL